MEEIVSFWVLKMEQTIEIPKTIYGPKSLTVNWGAKEITIEDKLEEYANELAGKKLTWAKLTLRTRGTITVKQNEEFFKQFFDYKVMKKGFEMSSWMTPKIEKSTVVVDGEEYDVEPSVIYIWRLKNKLENHP